MAAGLGYIEFATGDVLTAASANGYLASQVVMVFASATARTSAIASPQEGMISYLKDTNSTEYYSGSAWVAIGGATGGGMTLLSTTTLSGTNTDISVTAGYVSLYAEIFGITANTTDGYLQIYPNGTSGIAKGIVMKSVSGSNSFDNTTAIGVPNTVTRTDSGNAWVLTIDNPDSSTAHKAFQLWGGYNNGGVVMNNSGAITTNTAITSLRFTNAGGGTWAGGTVKLYGVK